MNSAAIPVELFNAVVEYLTQRPYGEVNQLIDALREQTKTVKLDEEESNDEE